MASVKRGGAFRSRAARSLSPDASRTLIPHGGPLCDKRLGERPIRGAYNRTAPEAVTPLLAADRHSLKQMRLTRKLVESFERGGLSARSVRLRLTALYGGLFVVCGAGLLVITYLLVSHSTRHRPAGVVVSGHPFAGLGQGERTIEIGRIGAALGYQNRVDLHQLLIESAIALAAMAALSVALGWVVAGRVLSPLRTITARTRRISEQSLHERLALSGPHDELKQLADTIDELLARLEAAFDSQRRFVANASHELRTPLAMMRTRLDVAIAKPDGVPPQTQTLNAGLRNDLDRADRLLESFLALARAQHGRLTDRTLVSLDQMVAHALATRHDQIAELELEVRTALGHVSVAGSEALLARMVGNVIENSVRHNEPHGFIDIACERVGETGRVVVSSGGPVLDEASVAKLVLPFQRLAAERTGAQNGHGLGLSIVAAVADAHGGSLDLHARPRGGLCVQIVLPSVTRAPTVLIPA
jgi:signal transduction histidine kinase